MMLRRVGASLVGGLWLALGATTPAALGQETKTVVAYSMKVAQAQVREVERQGRDFRRERADVFHLGGITTPWAVVVDPAAGDWIVVGEHDPKASALTLDDWVVALRARFVHVEADPGVTIDRRPSERCLKAGLATACLDASRQDVRFFGGVENTRFGHVCLEADRLMKRIGLALEPAPVKELKTYYHLALAELRKAGGRRREVASRFWFYPTVDRVNVLEDVVLLEQFRMGIFTEVLQVAVDGKPVSATHGLTDAPSDAFARSFNEQYDAIAAARPILDTLRGVTRLAALAKGLAQSDLRIPVDYYLQRYPVQPLATPTEHDVLTVQSPKPGIQLSGGVAVAALVSRLKGGDASGFKRLVLAARPSEIALRWSVPIAVRAGWPESVTLPVTAGDATEIATLFSRALFLQQTKHYDAAIETYGKVLARAPNLVVSAYVHRGQAYAQKGRYDLAIADYDREISLNPRLAAAYTSRGAAWGMSGDQDHAIADHDRAIVLNPGFAVAYNNRGVARNLTQDYEGAIRDFDQALSLDPGLAEAYLNRGMASVGKDPESPSAWRRALEDFDRTLDRDPLNASAYYWRGLARVDEYEQAIADLQLAATLDPGLASTAYRAQAELADHAGRPKDAATAFRKFLDVAPPTAPGIDTARTRLRELGGQR